MCQRHVTQVDIVNGEVEAQEVLAHLATDEIQMGQHWSFWFSSCTRGDTQQKYCVTFRFLLWVIDQVLTFQDQGFEIKKFYVKSIRFESLIIGDWVKVNYIFQEWHLLFGDKF